jgi:hypothetical protein
MAGYGPRVKLAAAKPGAVGLPGVADPAAAAEMEQRQAENLQDLQFPQIDAPPDTLRALGLDPDAVRSATGSISKVQPLPVRADPDILEKAQRDLALISLVRNFTGSAPVTAYGAKLGQRAGVVTETPASKALEALALAPATREQSRVAAGNQARDALNALAGGQAANVNQNIQRGQEAQQKESAANAAKATLDEQKREFDVSQQTAKDVAAINAGKLDKRMLEAQNKPPETPVRETARLGAEMMDFADQLEALIKKGGGSTLPLGATVDLGKMRLGTTEAQQAQRLMGAIKGHLAQVEERRKGNMMLDQAIGGIVPMAGMDKGLSLKGLQDVRKIGSGIHEAVAQLSPLWAFQSGIPRLKGHVKPEMLQRAQKTYSQQLEEALRESQSQPSPTFDPDAFLGKGQ